MHNHSYARESCRYPLKIRELHVLFILIFVIWNSAIFDLRFAALRELFRAKEGDSPSEYSHREFARNIELLQYTEAALKSEDEKAEKDVATIDELEKASPPRASLMSMNDNSDEFFDVPDASEAPYQLESDWSLEVSPEPSSWVLKLFAKIIFPQLLAATFLKQELSTGNIS